MDEFAEKLPDQWNSDIGENGCRLSGGERQRISIARAFLKDAPIILLDEATASLDVENETLIQQALSRLIKTKPCSSLPIACAQWLMQTKSLFWQTVTWQRKSSPRHCSNWAGAMPTW